MLQATESPQGLYRVEGTKRNFLTEDAVYLNALSHSGQVLMPLDDYGFSKQFGWVNDRFGVSWQLNLPAQ